MLRGRCSCAISERPTTSAFVSPSLPRPLTPLFPLDTSHSPVSGSVYILAEQISRREKQIPHPAKTAGIRDDIDVGSDSENRMSTEPKNSRNVVRPRFAGPSPAFTKSMRPLSHTRKERNRVENTAQTKLAFFVRRHVLACALLAMGAWTLSCGGGGAGSVTPPPPPPPSIQVVVTPNSGTVLLGETLPFTATVSNSSDTSVIWSVNGITGGSAQAGTISADGLYMAPADLPQGGTVKVTATSHADSSKFATASVSISSDIAVSISPGTASVELAQLPQFHE